MKQFYLNTLNFYLNNLSLNSYPKANFITSENYLFIDKENFVLPVITYVTPEEFKEFVKQFATNHGEIETIKLIRSVLDISLTDAYLFVKSLRRK